MVSACREEGGLIAEARHKVKAHQVVVEADRPLEIGDLQVYVADEGTGWNRLIGHTYHSRNAG
jgi:hypothetical protein